MTELEKRIKLVEARGWTVNPSTANGAMLDPNGKYVPRYNIPDPYTDANDCNSLIKHLNGLGWMVIIEHLLDRQSVEVRNEEIVHKWCYETPINWMHGVCELALKVIQGDSDG